MYNYFIDLTVSSLATNLKAQYKQRKFYIQEDDDVAVNLQQLHHPKNFVSVALHRIKEVDKEGIEKIASIMRSGLKCSDRIAFQNSEKLPIGNVFSIKEFISELFGCDETMQHKNKTGIKNSNMVLINGAPGMGKTTLCEEIAYQWAKGNETLKHIDLIFLMFMCDPKVSKIHSLQDFIHYFYDFKPAALEVAKKYAKLLENCKNIVIIFDGYDELCDIGKNNLVTRIINRKSLLHAKVVITSRPLATETLHKRVDVTVEMLGFDEESKMKYIKSELENDPEKLLKLQLYLENHTDIKNVCCIPIMMSVLVFLFKRSDELLTDKVNLYNIFICFVISRCRQRLEKNHSSDIVPLHKLPQVYQDYLFQFSKFAYEYVKSKKVVFTEEDINTVCSSFTLTDNKFYGLGLLNYTTYTELDDNWELKKYVYCSFVHLSVQEYLAAYYISLLKPCYQFQLLKDTFLVDKYLNIWIMFCKMIMRKIKSFGHEQILVYNNTQDITEEIRDKLHLVIENVFNTVQIKDLRVSSASNIFQILCFQTYNQSSQKFSFRAEHILAYLSFNNIANATDQIQMYLCCEYLWSISYKQMKNALLQNYSLAVMIVENVSLIGYRIGQHQLHNGLEINKFLQTLILKHCHIDINMANELSNYTKTNNNLQELIVTKSTIDKLNLSLSSLIYLDLRSNTMSAVMIDDLADLIKKNKLLEYVFLSNNNLQPSAVALLKAFKHTKRLKGLSLNNSNMGATAADYLANIIKNNRLIEILQLSSNNLQSSVLVVLQALQETSNLKILDLSNNNITGDKVANDVAAAIKSNSCLKQLGLGNNELKSSVIPILRALTENKTLEVLDLQNNNMTDDVTEILAKVITENTSLSRLYLAHNNFQSSAVAILKALKGISKLEALDLSYNNMTGNMADDLADVIKHNTCLVQLCLAGNDLKSSTSVILQALKGHSTLKILDLCKNSLTNVIVGNLADAIKSNTSLEQLYLSNNDLKSSASVILQSLKTTSKLNTLDLTNNAMKCDVAGDLADVIEANAFLENLHLAENNLKSSVAVILEALKSISNLKTLDLAKNNMIDDVVEDLVDVIKCNTYLQTLSLAHNHLKSSSVIKILKVLQKNTKLKVLDLYGLYMSESVAEDLASVIKSNTNLEWLYLANNSLKSSAGVILKALKDNSKLKALNLLNNHMTGIVAEDLADVIKSNPCLTLLTLSFNDLKLSASTILQALQKNSKLEILKLNGNYMTGKVAKDLADVLIKNPHLTQLTIANNDLRSSASLIFKALKRNAKLETLDVGMNNMTGDVANDLVDVINSCTCLQELRLQHSNLNSNICMILQALKHNSQLKILALDGSNVKSYVGDLADVIKCNADLKELYLSDNDLKSSLAIVLQALKRNSKLEVLHANNNNLSIDITQNLAEVIQRNNSLKQICLADNDLRFSASVVLQALQNHSKLTVLNLDNNQMTGYVAKILSKVVQNNDGLEELSLANNSLKSHAIGIIQALKGISTLKILDLSCNGMTAEVCVDLAYVIKANKYLEKISLNDNNLDTYVIVILRALQKISGLKLLNLRNTMMTEIVAKELPYIIKSNSCLEKLSLSNTGNIKSSAIAILQALQRNSKLQELDLSFNNLTSVIAEDLSEVIRCNPCLKTLTLGRNNLSSSAIVIIKALKRNAEVIEVLDLSYNSATSGITEDLVKLIRSNTSLKALGISTNNLQSSVIIILKALKQHSNLTVLNLDDNNMTGYIADDVVEVINNNVCLEHLGLAGYNLKSSAILILQALKRHSKLKILNLNENNMTGIVAKELVDVIKNNTSLEKIGLSSNELQSSAILILQALKSHSKLTVLNLDDNYMTGPTIADHIADVMISNGNLKELHIFGNDLYPSTAFFDAIGNSKLEIFSNSLGIHILPIKFYG